MRKKYFVIICVLLFVFSNLFSVIALDNEDLTKSSFIFNLNLSKRVLVPGESFDVSYQTNLDNLLVSALLIYPNGSILKLSSLDEIVTSEIGVYEIKVSASKEGYNTITRSEKFEVIEGFYYGEVAQSNNTKIYIIVILLLILYYAYTP